MGNGDSVDVNRNLAIRLVNFYMEAAKSKKGARAFVTCKAARDSNTLREISAINRYWINNWTKQWGVLMHL